MGSGWIIILCTTLYRALYWRRIVFVKRVTHKHVHDDARVPTSLRCDQINYVHQTPGDVDTCRNRTIFSMANPKCDVFSMSRACYGHHPTETSPLIFGVDQRLSTLSLCRCICMVFTFFFQFPQNPRPWIKRAKFFTQQFRRISLVFLFRTHCILPSRYYCCQSLFDGRRRFRWHLKRIGWQNVQHSRQGHACSCIHYIVQWFRRAEDTLHTPQAYR